RHIALKDRLTNLPNRRFIKQQLTSDIKTASKNSNKVGILFIDLDKFKLVNDTLGHSIGDHLLKKAAIRLNSVVIKENAIGRLGGDEFIVVLNDVTALEEIETVAKRILDLFREPFILREKQIHNTCSIGISIFPENGQDVETLFKNADIAMNMSKEKGRNNYRFYTDEMNKKAEENLEIVENLREALKRKEFVIHYQPKINIKTGEITGLEALVRWDHPDLGLVYPEYFISIAEEAGLINKIDEFVFEVVCLQIRNWINNGFSPINIAVNISPTFFNNIEFITKLETILNHTGVDASYLSVEITETAAMKDTGYVHNILNRLREKKIEISLDDFGTGYSSLSYLKIFPIDTLKIDQLFVNGINKDKRDESLIEATITMAKALDIKVISEGVETKEQLNYLKEIGCEEFQGFLFSKPVPIQEIEDMLSRNLSYKVFNESVC
ncbi:MAG: EAL domain-containing protein, partial [Clostridia bacterium]|nr:EAL domain-containing protein [Clostridia bacterium]